MTRWSKTNKHWVLHSLVKRNHGNCFKFKNKNQTKAHQLVTWKTNMIKCRNTGGSGTIWSPRGQSGGTRLLCRGASGESVWRTNGSSRSASTPEQWPTTTSPCFKKERQEISWPAEGGRENFPELDRTSLDRLEHGEDTEERGAHREWHHYECPLKSKLTFVAPEKVRTVLLNMLILTHSLRHITAH